MSGMEITICEEHETVNCGCINAETYTLVYQGDQS